MCWWFGFWWHELKSNLQGDGQESVCGHASLLVWVKVVFEHKLWLQQVPTVSVFTELALVQLHEFVASLVVEGHHLRADIPHGDGIVV